MRSARQLRDVEQRVVAGFGDGGAVPPLVAEAGGGGSSNVLAVRVKNIGGDGGGPYTEPTFTYAIYATTPANGTTWDAIANCLAVDAQGNPRAFTPAYTQRCVGLWSPAGNGSLGLATMAPELDGSNRDWRLLQCNERPVTGFCNV